MGAATERSNAILLGRTTYEMFEPAWSTRTVEDDPGAPFFNDTTKYVVSGTLTNSEILGPYSPETIRKLKDEVDGTIYVSGSGTLVRATLADGLHLFVYPWRQTTPLPSRSEPEADPGGVRHLRQRWIRSNSRDSPVTAALAEKGPRIRSRAAPLVGALELILENVETLARQPLRPSPPRSA
ncbi:MAG: dihydrofolate reductase family protein [Streptosporangiales bacterium]|nr:dihydrofolate reductase family protein [Streptosporangiales bacterium]MBO0889580.1 dihydrofolate reductase family protein [Acidothermales bacterium]